MSLNTSLVLISGVALIIIGILGSIPFLSTFFSHFGTMALGAGGIMAFVDRNS